MPFRVDLHVHSVGSPDGSLNAAQIARMFKTEALHCVAITDHDTIQSALELQKQLGPERIIVGEEITTAEGEIIGLFLRQAVAPGLSAAETVRQIKEQGGLVYIPHPFETVRKGIMPDALNAIAGQVDIVEVYNGRAVFQDRGAEAKVWATAHDRAMAAGSDAHGHGGWGRTCSILEAMPTQKTLVPLLRTATLAHNRVGLRGILYPKFNRLRKRVRHV